MNKIDSAISEFRQMDELASGNSPVHRLEAGIKLAVTVFYIICVVSVDKYRLSMLTMMIFYPLLMFQAAGLSMSGFFYKLRYVLPLVCMVGVFNPLLDTSPMMSFGNVSVSGGMISMLTLMGKGIFCLMASYVLVATTRFDSICAALGRAHVPRVMVTLMLLTYRYVSVMMQEVSVMSEAYALRAPGQKGIHISAWGSFLGQMLLRSMDRAQELYSSMLLRGFDGAFRYASGERAKTRDFVFLTLCLLSFAVMRFVDIPELIGSFFV
ncbi:MAG: energy-coupling factor transporter transmembrane protein EcfT [Eubacteriaceae bacterium]|nr:energy-coupling factor transporter transmembrane protein EcfT [Eubacteriaceae bacterium]